MLAAVAADPEPWLLALSAVVFAATFVPWAAAVRHLRQHRVPVSRRVAGHVHAQAGPVAAVSRHV